MPLFVVGVLMMERTTFLNVSVSRRRFACLGASLVPRIATRYDIVARMACVVICQTCDSGALLNGSKYIQVALVCIGIDGRGLKMDSIFKRRVALPLKNASQIGKVRNILQCYG